MNKLIELIESAYCWEGGAGVKKLAESTPELLVFAVGGSSTVEHSGDVDGIYGQVSDLRGETVTEDGKTYRILSATCTVIGDQDGDDDYEVSVSGKVTVKVSA